MKMFILRSSKSMVNPRIHDKVGENYANHGHESLLMKSNNLNNDRRVNFQDDGNVITQVTYRSYISDDLICRIQSE